MLELHVLLSGHRHLCFMDLYASALPPTLSLLYTHFQSTIHKIHRDQQLFTNIGYSSRFWKY